MAGTYELYLGGPRQQNTDWAIFPAAPFLVANTSNLAPPSKSPIVFGASRTLDFTNDKALAYFYRKNWVTPVINDVLGCVVVPAKSLFFGLFYNVNTIVAGTGGTMKFRFRTAAQDLATGIDPHVAGGSFVPYNGAGVITTADTITATFAKFCHYFAAPDIIDLVLTNPPNPVSLAALNVTITPVYFNFQTGMMN